MRIITDRFKVKVREELGLDIRTIPVSFIESDCFPRSFEQYNHKDARINVCQKIFEYNFTDVDIQAIIYHECVHAKQHQEGRYPRLDEEGNIKQYLIRFPIDDEFIEKRWNEFYEHMDFKNISRDIFPETGISSSQRNIRRKVVFYGHAEKSDGFNSYHFPESISKWECCLFSIFVLDL
nr:hypothetical protein [Odoribacter splanchnicus]